MNSLKIPTQSCGVSISRAIAINPELEQYLSQKYPPRLDLGDNRALLLYNKIILKEFMDLEFNIPSGFLVPTICSRWEFVRWMLYDYPKRVLEIGIGASAILALILAKIGCDVIGTEVNETAFQSAQENIKLNQLENKISLHLTRGNEIVRHFTHLDQFDAILCNPPQYDEGYFIELFSLNRGFSGNIDELVGGKTGIEFIIKLITEIKIFKSPPPLYLQITLPKLREPLNRSLKELNLSFREEKRKMGTRTRIYYKILFK